jgi:hypothetical protein
LLGVAGPDGTFGTPGALGPSWLLGALCVFALPAGALEAPAPPSLHAPLMAVGTATLCSAACAWGAQNAPISPTAPTIIETLRIIDSSLALAPRRHYPQEPKNKTQIFGVSQDMCFSGM